MLNINTVFTLFIIAMCLVFAYFMAFTDLKEDDLNGTPRKVFVAIMLLYAAFRGYRLVKAYRKQNENPE
ncbi:MAG: hypothetical protein A3D31_11660 [Candidatus Fluviicola riflensis]|nr:MAG: hypothetical protein CHH17_16090 [Candidatus Fluviicola riflensis]OGS77644.1 MAG: hypothetical protein A3D31_11660 [Candidatus Fluviicola riflensis]OGS84227.1 MAG: hypothetical protein A3E30_13070 [Fluviicola sp. RIFCSPHIGHO2_12_FULL_43_24]OGS84710.1 MAG: hypothetical protein A2724_08595 [Fluviicola sp. RIFCSPHIGHO2_01_FULL_43_53]